MRLWTTPNFDHMNQPGKIESFFHYPRHFIDQKRSCLSDLSFGVSLQFRAIKKISTFFAYFYSFNNGVLVDKREISYLLWYVALCCASRLWGFSCILLHTRAAVHYKRSSWQLKKLHAYMQEVFRPFCIVKTWGYEIVQLKARIKTYNHHKYHINEGW